MSYYFQHLNGQTTPQPGQGIIQNTWAAGDGILCSSNGQYYASLGDDGILAVFPGTVAAKSDPNQPTVVTASGPAIWTSPNQPLPLRKEYISGYNLYINENGKFGITSYEFYLNGTHNLFPDWESEQPLLPGTTFVNPYLILQNDGLLCLRAGKPSPDQTGIQSVLWHSTDNRYVKGIKVFNGGAYVVKFMVLVDPDMHSNNPGYTGSFPAGKSKVIEFNFGNGSTIWPKIATVTGVAGETGDYAEGPHQFLYDPSSIFYGKYKATGTVLNCSMDWEGVTTDPD